MRALLTLFPQALFVLARIVKGWKPIWILPVDTFFFGLSLGLVRRMAALKGLPFVFARGDLSVVFLHTIGYPLVDLGAGLSLGGNGVLRRQILLLVLLAIQTDWRCCALAASAAHWLLPLDLS